MKTSLADLLDELESLTASMDQALPDESEGLLAERKRILDRIQEIAVGGLNAVEQSALSKRLRRVYARNQELALTLAQRRDEMRDELDSLATGRRALQGYHSGDATGRRVRRSV